MVIAVGVTAVGGRNHRSDRNSNSPGCSNAVGAIAAASVLAGRLAAEDAVGLQLHIYSVIQNTFHLLTQLTQLPMDWESLLMSILQ